MLIPSPARVRKILGRSAVLSLLVALGTACDPAPMYEEYVELPERGWYRDSSITFSVDIEDTSSAYQVVWYLRNNDQYDFSNIWLFRSVTSDRGREFGDTAEFYLADPYGKWLGEGVGELKTNTWPFKEQLLRFNRSGEYTFRLQQAMRTDYLQGVEDVGLGIYKIEKEENGEEVIQRS